MKWRSAAKINLTLDVLGRRPDGYHELRSIVHTVGLWDELEFAFNNTGRFVIRCNESELETDGNLCLRAARLWFDAARKTGQPTSSGAQIQLLKRIPSGAGLGGASGNAAATLVALNEAHDLLLTEGHLERLALQLGADVPFFLHGGCALMEGIGEKLTPLPPLEAWVLILMPATKLSTPVVYNCWDGIVSRGAGSRKFDDHTPALLAAMADAAPAWAMPLGNDLAEAAGLAGVAVYDLLQLLRRHGALGASMTGSGSAVFGIFASAETARNCSRQVEAEASQNHLQRWVASLSTEGVMRGRHDNHGPREWFGRQA